MDRAAFCGFASGGGWVGGVGITDRTTCTEMPPSFGWQRDPFSEGCFGPPVASELQPFSQLGDAHVGPALPPHGQPKGMGRIFVFGGEVGRKKSSLLV